MNKKTHQRLIASILLCCSLMSIYSRATNSSQKQPDREIQSLLQQVINHSESFQDHFEAEVWLRDMSSRLEFFIKDEEQRLFILNTIHLEAKRHQLPPEIILALIETESHFDQYAISRVGAQGLMQIMPFWKNHIGTNEDNLTDIQTNIRYGCTVLKTYLLKEKGHLQRALARYNGSLGKSKYYIKVLNAWEERWKNGPLPSFKEYKKPTTGLRTKP